MSRLSMLDGIQEMLPYARHLYRNEEERAYLEGHEAGSCYGRQCAGMSGDPPGWQPLKDDLEEEVDGFDPAMEGELDALTARLKEMDIMPELLGRIERQIPSGVDPLGSVRRLCRGVAEDVTGEAHKGPP
jgi:hypothetical protein